jgi:type IV secretion system protein VirB4
MDTDGSLSNGGFDYISKSEQLADDVCFVARSLGLKAHKNECRKKCYNNGKVGTYYRVSISGNAKIIPTKITRKSAQARLQKKNPMVTGFSIKYVGEDDFYG